MFPSPLRRFVELFNREEFWESHEVLEAPWRERGSPFYQGLILFASAYVHVQRGNPHGVVAQLRKAEQRLAPYAPHHLGIDVERVLEEARRLRARVEAEGAGKNGAVWLEQARFPRLRLRPELVRGDEPEGREE